MLGRRQEELVTEVHLRTAIEQSPLGTIIVDPDGRCILVNAAWNDLWGMGEDSSLVGSSIFDHHQALAMGLIPYVKECMGDGGVITPLLFYESAPASPDATSRWFKAFIYAVRDEAGGLLQVGIMLEDFTGRKTLEEQLAHQAFHDSLTGLPNRALLADRLGHALSVSRQKADRNGGVSGEGDRVALLFLDLDDFKRVNDTLGHTIGDQLLVKTARRVEASLRPGDTFARLGGDEFAVLLDEAGAGGAGNLAGRLLEALRAPFLVNGHELFVTFSIGVALSDVGEEGGEDLLRRADVAMYRSKRSGKNRYNLLSREAMSSVLRSVKLKEDLRRAIEREEFRVYYQPLVLLETEEVVSYEALLRWEHPEHGLLEPADFIPLAEENGSIIPLGRWVLREACRQAPMLWEQTSPEESLKVMINLSPLQFRHPSLVESVTTALSESGLQPRNLVLDITESVMMDENATAEAMMRALENRGVKFALDDFGTGYSSLAYLTKIPASILKIDRTLIAGVDENPEGSAVVSSIINLAHALKLTVVAEGVETTGELEELRSLGCDLGQGYHWRRPYTLARVG
ncbi:MAG: EAL domain-containing protein [Actinomycetota bacterium]|nr:EAL domain-containing protein [Actinomycetota bacterium]